MPVGTLSEKIRSSVKHYVFYLTFERALEKRPVFRDGGGGIIALSVPTGRKAEDYKTCAVAYLFGDIDRSGWENLGYALVSASDKPERVKAEFAEKCVNKKRAIVLTEVKSLPAIVSVALDEVIDIDPIRAEDLREACSQVLKFKISAKQAKHLMKFPWELMLTALRRASSAADAIRRLETVSPDASERRPLVERTLRLDELHGYGLAKEWGEQLAKDLEAWRTGQLKWSDVDRGLLLSGPPGVGKTIFARALAGFCGVNFVATSVVQWQAKGHLGDLLKAMRSDFALAIEMAPTILLLDELDSIGNRETFSGEYASYSIQIVNALLEALDGSANRDGLVVIGATNFPDKIDAAVRRPGRLDRHVAIGMPSEADRLAIVGQMLGDDVPSDIQFLGPATEGMAGADLARMVRDARKLARRQIALYCFPTSCQDFRLLSQSKVFSVIEWQSTRWATPLSETLLRLEISMASRSPGRSIRGSLCSRAERPASLRPRSWCAMFSGFSTKSASALEALPPSELYSGATEMVPASAPPVTLLSLQMSRCSWKRNLGWALDFTILVLRRGTLSVLLVLRGLCHAWRKSSGKSSPERSKS